MIDAFAAADRIEDLSLYIHVPFCLRKCHYCDFFSAPCRSDDQTILAYGARMLAEVRQLNRVYPKPFTTVYIGGGNPGMLPDSLMAELLDEVHANGDPDEVSVEMNPESLDEKRLSMLSGRIDRLSIGVQSLQAINLQMIGRNSTRERTLSGLNALHHVRDAFEINCDILNAIPGQQYQDTVNDISYLYELIRPDHFSVYDLILEEGTPLHTRLSIDPLYKTDVNGNFDIDTANVKHYLESLGYGRYEVSSYARDKRTCRHNQRYWKMRPYLGIGPSAVSTLPVPGGIARVTCTPDNTKYIAADSILGQDLYEVERISPLEFLEEICIMGLRTAEGIDLARVEEDLDISLAQAVPKTLHKYRERGDLLEKPGFITASASGMVKLNTILLDIFLELEGTEVSYTQALDTVF